MGSSSHYASGFESAEATREQYYESVHPQTIEFAIAEAVTRELTEAVDPGKEKLPTQCRQALFPQTLRIVKEYIETRVDLNGMNPRDIGLQVYAQRIVDLLVSAIRPDTAAGEAPELPRLNRYQPFGSSGNVHFKTTKPVQATTASHVNYVACDTGSWEQAAMFQLEELARRGVVRGYVRNDGLDFSIPYDRNGYSAAYEPDFIVEMADGSYVVLEIKGYERRDVGLKHEAAKRWARAVSHWRQLGDWEFLVCREPQRLGYEIERLAAARKARYRREAARLHAQAREEEPRLRAAGWKKKDFANALVGMLDEPDQPWRP